MDRRNVPAARKRRRGRNGARLGIEIIFKLFGFCVMCCAVFFATTVFFKIETITVMGEHPYAAEDIIKASGIETGENTFFVNKFSAIDSIFASCPYLDEISIRRHLPSKLEIKVTQCIPAAVFEYGGTEYIIDKNGKILGPADEEESKKYAVIKGGEPQSAEVGKYIDFLQKEKEKTLLSILLITEKYDIISEISEINLEKLYNLTFSYKDRFKVELGSGEKIEEKIKLLLLVEQKLGQNETGVIDISDTENIRVRPE